MKPSFYLPIETTSKRLRKNLPKSSRNQNNSRKCSPRTIEFNIWKNKSQYLERKPSNYTTNFNPKLKKLKSTNKKSNKLKKNFCKKKDKPKNF